MAGAAQAGRGPARLPALDRRVEQENTPTLYTCRCLLRGRSASARPQNIYRGILAGLLVCLSLTLLTILDIRRGFLFTNYATRSSFYVLHGLHGPLLAVGVLGVLICLTRLRTLEHKIPATGSDRWLAYAIAAVLIADLIAYRAVPAARSLTAGGINVAWLDAFGTIGPWRSVALATSYLLTVWHATMLGILIAGLATIAMPQAFRLYLTRHGVTGSVAGALCALPQPFCSCCASTMAPSFVRQGASTHFVLAFVVGAPMLNVTTIILAGAMLPTRFAVIRIGAGVVVTVLVSYWVARLTTGTGVATTSSPSRWYAWLQRAGGVYASVFEMASGGSGERTWHTPSQMFAAWLRQSGRLALVLIPTLWVSSALAALMFDALPPLENNLTGVGLAAAAGTVFMISTWSEIPIALQLIHAGLPGPAAALLVVLPAISLPCMVILAGALQRLSVVVMLSAAVMLVGVIAGALFL